MAQMNLSTEKKIREGFLKSDFRRLHHGSAVMNPTSVHEVVGAIPGLTLWVGNLALP